jgi:SAM-dependent methyltransferase
MKKPYEGHEDLYRRMRKKGILSWTQIADVKKKAIEPHAKRFLNDVLSQPFAPRKGKAIELGCGTAPILRLVCKKGFAGLGIDVSKTAIAVAKEQSVGLNIKFKRADICNFDVRKIGKFDIAIDGFCLHCIIRSRDRKTFLRNTFKLLKEGGLLIVMSMCSPVNRKVFSQTWNYHKLIGHTVYTHYDTASEYEGFRVINGQACLPTRKMLHWKSILTEIRKAGFQIKLFRYDGPTGKVPNGDISVAALRSR